MFKSVGDAPKSSSKNVTSKSVSTALIVFLLAFIVWDSVVMFWRKDDASTITYIIRGWNRTTGGLVALGLAAVWIHIFVRLPQYWVGTGAN